MVDLARIIGTFGDAYERPARLYPALLAIAPFACMLLIVHGQTVAGAAISTLVAFGALYALASVSRSLGKSLEPSLYEEWGGKPTTQLLRHRNSTIDPVTKQRYHAFLASKIKTPFPTSHEESTNPGAADQIYESGVRWLLNNAQDKRKYPLTFKDNVSYGFHRNSRGLKWIGIALALLSLLWIHLTLDFLSPGSIQVRSLLQLSFSADYSYGSVIALAFLCYWSFYITNRTVRTAAFSYAEMLLRACDGAPKRT